MKTLFILSFLFWSLLGKAESTACPGPTHDSRDINMCSAASITNVSIVRVIPTATESKQCFCEIKLYKPTNLSFNYYGPDANACGIQINIDHVKFMCHTASSILSLNKSTETTYTFVDHYDWCMVIRTEPPTDQDARFSILCNSNTATTMSSQHPSMSHVVSESTTPSSETNTTYLKLTSHPSSLLPITDASATNATVTSVFPLTTASTGESQSSYHKTSGTTSIITHGTSSKSQPRQELKDIHIVIIAVVSTCCLLVALTVAAICCFVRRRAKGTHSYENNQLDDSTNLHSTHDYTNINNQKNCDLEVINQMYVPADDIAFNSTNPSETSTDNKYADVGELTVKQNLETDIFVVNSASKESDRGINDNAEINESVISEADVDKLYSVVQKNRDTDSKAKKVSFSVGNQDVSAISTESHGTHDIYARVNKTS